MLHTNHLLQDEICYEICLTNKADIRNEDGSINNNNALNVFYGEDSSSSLYNYILKDNIVDICAKEAEASTFEDFYSLMMYLADRGMDNQDMTGGTAGRGGVAGRKADKGKGELVTAYITF
jgi:hypothetical protein